jgi:hypothetical protein
MGRVGIYVLNSLRGPATVSTSVQLLIEANGGPDFELSAPIDANFTPALGVFTPQVGGEMFHPQVLGDDAAECGNAVSMPIADTIASSSNHTGGFAAVRYCTGESVVSMRQMMKRCCPKFSFPIGINAGIQIMPFDIRLPYFIASANPVVSADTSVDYYDVLGNCFAFSRGGVRWKIWSQGGGIITYKSRLATSQSGNLYEGVTNTTKSLVSSVVSSVNVMTGALEIEVPQYGVSHMRMNRAGRYGAANTISTMNTPLAIEYIGDHAVSTPYFHYRQCSDDTDFGFFYGVTLLIPSTGALSSTAPW